MPVVELFKIVQDWSLSMSFFKTLLNPPVSLAIITSIWLRTNIHGERRVYDCQHNFFLLLDFVIELSYKRQGLQMPLTRVPYYVIEPLLPALACIFQTSQVKTANRVEPECLRTIMRDGIYLRPSIRDKGRRGFLLPSERDLSPYVKNTERNHQSNPLCSGTYDGMMTRGG